MPDAIEMTSATDPSSNGKAISALRPAGPGPPAATSTAQMTRLVPHRGRTLGLAITAPASVTSHPASKAATALCSAPWNRHCELGATAGKTSRDQAQGDSGQRGHHRRGTDPGDSRGSRDDRDLGRQQATQERPVCAHPTPATPDPPGAEPDPKADHQADQDPDHRHPGHAGRRQGTALDGAVGRGRPPRPGWCASPRRRAAPGPRLARWAVRAALSSFESSQCSSFVVFRRLPSGRRAMAPDGAATDDDGARGFRLSTGRAACARPRPRQPLTPPAAGCHAGRTR